LKGEIEMITVKLVSGTVEEIACDVEQDSMLEQVYSNIIHE
jgi:hypothetical protein